MLPSPAPLCFLTALATPHCFRPPCKAGGGPSGPCGCERHLPLCLVLVPCGLHHSTPDTGALGTPRQARRISSWGLEAGGGKQRGLQYPHTLPLAAGGIALTFMGHTGGTHRHQKDHHDIAAGGGPPEPLAWLPPSSPAHVRVMSSPKSSGWLRGP